MTRADVARLVDQVAEGIAQFREPHIAGVLLTDKQVLDRARNIVQGLLGSHRIEPIAKETAP